MGSGVTITICSPESHARPIRPDMTGVVVDDSSTSSACVVSKKNGHADSLKR